MAMQRKDSEVESEQSASAIVARIVVFLIILPALLIYALKLYLE
jgi:hypothetical protein